MTKRPLVHLHRSQSSRCWTGPHWLSQSRGHFTFDNFWLPHCARKLSGGELPWQPVAVAERWLFFDRHRRMSDFTGTDRREGGREEMEGIGRWKWRKGMSRAPRLTKGSMCNHYSSPSLSWAALKKKIIYCFFLIPVKVGAVLTTRALFSLWLFDNGKAVGSYLPKWWPDKGFFSLFFWFFLPKWKKRPRFWWETERENHPPGGSKN